MKIPVFSNIQFVDKATGYLTDIWGKMLNQLFDQLQKNVSDEGFVIPSLSTDDILKLTNAVDGTLIYDETLNVLKIRKNGVFTTIQTL